MRDVPPVASEGKSRVARKRKKDRALPATGNFTDGQTTNITQETAPMTLTTKIRPLIASLAFAAFAFTATASLADEAKVPTTAAEHEALAKQYKDQSVQYRKVADDHRAMAAAYSAAHQPTNGPTPNAGAVKMKKHCEQIAKDADKLASDTEKAADYHTMRSKELQGK